MSLAIDDDLICMPSVTALPNRCLSCGSGSATGGRVYIQRDRSSTSWDPRSMQRWGLGGLLLRSVCPCRYRQVDVREVVDECAIEVCVLSAKAR